MTGPTPRGRKLHTRLLRRCCSDLLACLPITLLSFSRLRRGTELEFDPKQLPALPSDGFVAIISFMAATLSKRNLYFYAALAFTLNPSKPLPRHSFFSVDPYPEVTNYPADADIGATAWVQYASRSERMRRACALNSLLAALRRRA